MTDRLTIFSSDILMRLHLPFRADSLLGLIHTAPSLVGGAQLARLGGTLHAFTVRDSRVPSGGH